MKSNKCEIRKRSVTDTEVCFCEFNKNKTKSFTRRLTWARFTIMMTLLTAELRFEKSFRTFWMAFAAGQLPIFRARNALITSWSAAGCTAQIAFGASASIAVVSVRFETEQNEEKNIIFFLFWFDFTKLYAWLIAGWLYGSIQNENR